MRVKSIELKNYRGFREGELELPDEPVTVFAGPNGCGKSSVLEAVGSILSGVGMILAGVGRAAFMPRAGFAGGGEDGPTLWGVMLDLEDVECPLSLMSPNNRPPMPTFPILGEWTQRIRDAQDAELTLPVVTFMHSGSTRRVGQEDEVQAPSFVGRLRAYEGAFQAEAAHFEDFERWFEQEENLENEEKIRKSSLKWQRPTLKCVRTALKTFLSALQDSRLEAVHVIRHHVDGPLSAVRGRLAVDKDGGPLFVDQLSDGERRLVLLVGDIARRMAILNPHLAAPGKSPGVVLVDEVDLHLHPSWQRRVVPALRKAFPEVQLLVTTHSPQVLASVPSASVVLMNNFAFLPGHPRTWGRDTNTLLEDVFGVSSRPQEVKDQLQRFYELLEDKPHEARRLYKELYKALEATDPELARIETLLALMGE